MPKFVIEREIPGAGNLSEAELRELSRKSARRMGLPANRVSAVRHLLDPSSAE